LQPPSQSPLPALLASDIRNLNGNLAEQHAMSAIDFCGLPAKAKSASRLSLRHDRSHRRSDRKIASSRRIAAGTQHHAPVATP